MLLSQRSLLLQSSAPTRELEPAVNPAKPRRCRTSERRSNFLPFPDCSELNTTEESIADAPRPILAPVPPRQEAEIDPLYLFARYIQWEQEEEPSAAWDLIQGAESAHGDTRAQARALLANSRHLGASTPIPMSLLGKAKYCDEEADMNTPYGLNLIEDCTECPHSQISLFCGLSEPVVQELNAMSHRSTLPAGAVLFVEGQTPRGMFVLCSGRVNLSTTSREGKSLILRTAEAGEALGLSAAISGLGYEMTAETAIPCQVNFLDRKRLLDLIETHSEVGLHTSQCLSRDFHAAYHDIRDLVLTRSSAGKLAKLLLSQSGGQSLGDCEVMRVRSCMTHEEMAQRIGASRETVTRLLSDLRRRRLIQVDGASLIIPDRNALEALAV